MGGRDKAEIVLPTDDGDGRPLWRRQVDDVLRPLGPTEIFLSGPPRDGLPADVRVLTDEPPGGFGPLAGIAVALKSARSPLVVVLAVDLPTMTAGFLRERLLPGCTTDRGAVGRWMSTDDAGGSGGFFEPLAAVYPRAAHTLVGGHLRGPDRSLQAFVHAARTAGLIRTVPLTEPDRRWFVNWNAPGDFLLPRFTAAGQES